MLPARWFYELINRVSSTSAASAQGAFVARFFTPNLKRGDQPTLPVRVWTESIIRSAAEERQLERAGG
jgi:hypothetical protein